MKYTLLLSLALSLGASSFAQESQDLRSELEKKLDRLAVKHHAKREKYPKPYRLRERLQVINGKWRCVVTAWFIFYDAQLMNSITGSGKIHLSRADLGLSSARLVPYGQNTWIAELEAHDGTPIEFGPGSGVMTSDAYINFYTVTKDENSSDRALSYATLLSDTRGCSDPNYLR